MSDEPTTDVVTPRPAMLELHDPATGDRYVSGWGLIWHAAEVPMPTIEREVTHEHGDDWDHLIVEVQHLRWTPRVKWCSNHDGFGCDNEGEWHGHWFGVKHNPLSDCCHVVVLPSWTPRNPPAEHTQTAANCTAGGPGAPISSGLVCRACPNDEEADRG